MIRDRFKYTTNGYYGTPKTHKPREEPPKPILSEQQLALTGLIFSIFVVFAKIYYNHYETLHKMLLERKLVSYEVLTADGEVMLQYAWTTVVKYSRFWLPALCGFSITYFTWIIIYLDSNIPGVNPPSPLSPKKYRERSGHTFHLNYVFAILVGIITFLYMLYRGVEISYST